MMNQNRIIPVTQSDLISLYSVSLLLADDTIAQASVANADVPAVFDIADVSGKFLLDEPVKKVTVADGAEVTLYLVAAYDFDGIYVAGSDEPLSADIDADGKSLFKVVIASGAATVSKVGF